VSTLPVPGGGFVVDDEPGPPLPEVVGDRVGLVVGHSLPFDEYTGGAVRREVTVADGPPVVILDLDDFVVLPRHGVESFTPAHRLPHHAHIAALARLGCNRLVAMASVGSLRPDWAVGTVVAPDDFIGLQVNPSFHADVLGHTVPGFDPGWRRAVIEGWRSSTTTPITDGGVYAQSTGPRFETPAEVRMLAAFADVVGMTMVAECILAREAGLAYAAVCTVDNLANGLGETPLTEQEFRRGVEANRRRLRADLAALLPALTP
jgi:5'-methylthioadenosine phosphorylase